MNPTHFAVALRRTSWGVAVLVCVHGVFLWLWCVLPQRLNRRARAVKAPVRFPLCAWLHCRREDSLQVPGCSECAPLPTLPGFKTRKRRALPEGAVVRFLRRV